jgi:hypothetical protein
MIGVLLSFILCHAASSIMAPYQCPTPEDRAVAWYIDGGCRGEYSCCYTEMHLNVTASCCYTYGTNGPVKCCGRDNALPVALIVILSTAGGLLFAAGLGTIAACHYASLNRQRPVAAEEQVKEIEDEDEDISLDALEEGGPTSTYLPSHTT